MRNQGAASSVLAKQLPQGSGKLRVSPRKPCFLCALRNQALASQQQNGHLPKCQSQRPGRNVKYGRFAQLLCEELREVSVAHHLR